VHQENIFGKCDIDIVVNSVFYLILKELSDPFYIFQIFSIVLWLVEGYYNYAAVLIMTTVISITIAIKETRSNLLNIKKMAKYSCDINVFRQNEVVFS
jgi:magnesium-transporting ATPase (P-type)